MNNIEILEKLKDEQYDKETLKTICVFYDEDFKPYVLSTEEREALENLIQENKELRIQISARETVVDELEKENKELKEKFDVIQRKIYRLEEDNIELLKPRGKDQLNYKYIECPKVEAEWYKSQSYIKDNYIPKSKIKEKIEELEKEYKILQQTSDFIIADTIQPKIEVLQELLEGE